MPRTLSEIDLALETAETSVSQLQSDIIDLGVTAAQASADATDAVNSAGSALTQAQAASAAAATATAAVSGKAEQSEVTAIISDLNDAEQAIGLLQTGKADVTAITLLSGDISTQQAALSNLQSEVAQKASQSSLTTAVARITAIEAVLGGGPPPPPPPPPTGVTPASLDYFRTKVDPLLTLLIAYNRALGALATTTIALGATAPIPVFDPAKFRALKVSRDAAVTLRSIPAPTPAQVAVFTATLASWQSYFSQLAAAFPPNAVVYIPEIAATLKLSDVAALNAINFA